MSKTVFVCALTLALAVSGTAFAQSTTIAPKTTPPDAVNARKPNQQSVVTIEKVKQDLQKAGFTDVKVLDDAFLIQAKTKDGNPIIMTIGSNGMTALEMSMPGGASQVGTTGQAPPDKTPTAPAKPVQH